MKIEKSVDGVLGIRTGGCRMVGADETTEPWRTHSFTLLSDQNLPKTRPEAAKARKAVASLVILGVIMASNWRIDSSFLSKCQQQICSAKSRRLDTAAQERKREFLIKMEFHITRVFIDKVKQIVWGHRNFYVTWRKS